MYVFCFEVGLAACPQSGLCHTSLETRSRLKAWPVASIRAGRLPRRRLSKDGLNQEVSAWHCIGLTTDQCQLMACSRWNKR